MTDYQQLSMELRNDAMARAEKGAGEIWKIEAQDALVAVATRMYELTSDDVRDELHRRGIPEPKEMRALGPIMMWGARSGYIVRTGKVLRGTRPGHHLDMAAVWRSTIYGKELK